MLFFGNLDAQIRHYTVSVENGLSNSSINSILQDNRGRLWLSTWDGVNIYNGNSINILKNVPNNDNSLMDNVVRDIVQEDEKCFWAITELGVNRIDISQGTVRRYRLGYEKSNPFSGGAVSMTITRDGKVFCASKGWGIVFYNRNEDRMQPFNIMGLNTSSIISMAEAGENLILAQTDDGCAYLIEYQSNKEGVVTAFVRNEVLSKSTKQYTLSEDEGYVYLIGKSHVYKYSKENYSVADSIEFAGAISYSAIAPDGSLYVVSDRSNVFSIDFDEKKVSLKHELCRDNLLSFCFGTQDVIWLAIDGVGLEAYYKDSSALGKIESKALFGKNAGAVTSAIQMADGKIYLSVLGGGIYVLDSKGNPIGSLTADIPDVGYVFSMTEGPANSLIIGSRNVISVYIPSEKRTLILNEFDSNPPVVSYCMYYDKDARRLWVGTLDSGIYRFDLSARGNDIDVTDLVRYCYVAEDSTSIGSNNVMHIAPGHDNKLWVGTLGGGLNLLDVDTGKFRRFNSNTDQLSVPSDNVRFSFQDEDGSVWVGTSYGFCHGVPNASGDWEFESFNESDGLSDNTIHAILKDEVGNIWLSTNKGLSSFCPKDKSFAPQSSRENLQSLEFYVHSCMKTNDGEMYFGGVSGLNHFYPHLVKPREYSPEIVFENLTIRLDESEIITGEPIVLPYKDNFFNIGFAAIEYINNSNCLYAYTLEGFSKEWDIVPAGRPATFTNVPPGTYKFRVKSTNGDGVWCDNEQSFELTIKTPWYKSVWALIAYIIMTALAVIYIRNAVRYRHKQQLMLANEASERQRQKETYEAKLNFFTNIAHEFGTPLTLISCSGERLAASVSSHLSASKYAKIITTNAARMQKLIHELLEFRKVESGHYNPQYSKVKPKEMLQSILREFVGIGESNKLELDIDVSKADELFISDVSALEKIFINLISNAYKYTPFGGNITIRLENTDNGELHFSVVNTSKGLSPEKLKHVFDRFVILDNLEQQMAKGKVNRTGIGMALVQSLINMLGGRISVDSELEKSVTFEFYLPSGRESDISDIPKQSAVQVPFEIEEIERSDSGDLPATASERYGVGFNIMIVDDDAQIRDMVSDVLGDYYHVTKATDGKQALEMLQDMRPDLIITDINMPNINGIQFVKHLKSTDLTKSIPVIFLALKTDVGDEIATYNIGAEAFIQKPFLPAQLTAIVKGILKNRLDLKDYYTSAKSDMAVLNGVTMSLKDREFMSSVVKIIEDRMSENLSPSELSESMCISEMTLYRKIKQLTGSSPGEFIRKTKISHAAMLLRTTKMTVQQVMFDCGFNNKSWFYRKFTETYNLSPKEYRKSSEVVK